MTMILMVWALAQTPAAPTCQISGSVDLRRNGVSKSPSGAAVVYVKQVERAVWPSSPEAKATILQRGKQFAPRLSVVLKGQEVVFTNEDAPTEHQVFVRQHGAPTATEVGRSKDAKTGTWPAKEVGHLNLGCNIHPTMSGNVLVVDNPFFAMVAEGGKFTLPPLPADRDYVIVAWEANGATTSHEVKGCRGRQVVPFKLNGNAEPLATDVTGRRKRKDYRD